MKLFGYGRVSSIDEEPVPATDREKLLAELGKVHITWSDLNKYFVDEIVLHNDVAKFPTILKTRPDLARRCLEAFEGNMGLDMAPANGKEIRGYERSWTVLNSRMGGRVEDALVRRREGVLYRILLRTLAATGSRATLASYGCAS